MYEKCRAKILDVGLISSKNGPNREQLVSEKEEYFVSAPYEIYDPEIVIKQSRHDKKHTEMITQPENVEKIKQATDKFKQAAENNTNNTNNNKT